MARQSPRSTPAGKLSIASFFLELVPTKRGVASVLFELVSDELSEVEETEVEIPTTHIFLYQTSNNEIDDEVKKTVEAELAGYHSALPQALVDVSCENLWLTSCTVTNVLEVTFQKRISVSLVLGTCSK